MQRVEGKVFCFIMEIREKFLESFEFVVFCTRVIIEFVEGDDRPFLEIRG